MMRAIVKMVDLRSPNLGLSRPIKRVGRTSSTSSSVPQQPIASFAALYDIEWKGTRVCAKEEHRLPLTPSYFGWSPIQVHHWDWVTVSCKVIADNIVSWRGKKRYL